MSNRVFNLDDPHNINNFLVLIGASPVASPPEQNDTDACRLSPVTNAESQAAGTDLPRQEEQDRSAANSRSRSASASSEQETQAPQLIPATNAAASNTAITSLEPVKVDGSDILRTIADSSNLNLNDSIYAPKNYKQNRMTNANAKYASVPARRAPVMSFNNSFAALDEDATTESASKKSPQGKLVTKYQDEVIANFVKEKSPKDERKPSPQLEPFPAWEDLDMDSAIVESADKVTQSTIDTPESIKKTTGIPAMTVRLSQDARDGEDNDGDEDRENLKHFKSWGKPTPRNHPTARVRKIILSNLPPDSDLTLVQSLVYGGAIEVFNLSASKTSAFITFVDADACDAFFNAHPNGVSFRNPKTRRNQVVYVEKGQEVDVLSSILQAYLDCQASRVVRATGADEDWGMRALYKLAEAKNRKVETIVDTYRDQIRTIIFRFTNIADAVTFRHQLLRDEDWEMCNIQFMDDPVEKATGVHLEE